MMYNATRYEVTVEVIENVPADTDLFTFTFFMNNNNLTDSFGLDCGAVVFTILAEGETNFQFSSIGGIGKVVSGLPVEQFNVIVFTVAANNDIAVGFYLDKIRTNAIDLDQLQIVNFTVNFYQVRGQA